jgi:hypothetical protein
MALDASEQIGAPQLAGTLVMPKGTTKKTALGGAGIGVGGALGAAISSTGSALADRGRGPPTSPLLGGAGTSR